MNFTNRNEDGNTLFLVVIVFAVILMIGTGLIGTTLSSQKNAIMQKERQQGYYAAKSIVDSFMSDVMSDTTRQNELIGSSGKLLGEASEEVEIYDGLGDKWRCKVKIISAGDKIKVIGTATNDKFNITESITAVMKKDDTQTSSSLKVFSDININSDKALEMIEMSSKGGKINAKAEGFIKLDLIQAHSTVDIVAVPIAPLVDLDGDGNIDAEDQDKNGRLEVGNIITGISGTNVLSATPQDVTLSAAKDIVTGNIYGKNIIIKSTTNGSSIEVNGDLYATGNIKIEGNGPVIIRGSMVANDNIIINTDSDGIGGTSPVTYDKSKVWLVNWTGKDNISFGQEWTGVKIEGTPVPGSGFSGSNSVETFAKNRIQVKEIKDIPWPGSSIIIPVTGYITGDVTFVRGTLPNDRNNLIAEYYEGAIKRQVVIEPDDGTGNGTPAYKFIMGGGSSKMLFGVQRESSEIGTVALPTSITDSKVVGIDGKLKDSSGNYVSPAKYNRYNISTEVSGTLLPGMIKFYKNTDVRYFGNFHPATGGAGGFEILGDSKGLKFGEATYVFEKYEE